MSDDNQSVTPETTPAATSNEISEVARKLITEANAEAAKYRTQRNTIEADTTAKLKSEFEEQFKVMSDSTSALTEERNNAVSMVDKLKVALEAGVPGETAIEFAGLLQGSNTDEYKAHADKLKAMFGAGSRVKAVDPSAGHAGAVDNTPESEFMRLIQSKLTKK